LFVAERVAGCQRQAGLDHLRHRHGRLGDTSLPANGVLVAGAGRPDASLESSGCRCRRGKDCVVRADHQRLTYEFTFDFEKAGETTVRAISAGEAHDAKRP
jgi:hypothetical protein